ncbi:MAG: exodeoxyribonuclease VII large subunit [Christensenellales bacterium]|nr:exodeoxyribonuclease VII large subunit [Clostridia bacterium]HRU84487.1 exodeoxyribonuclease VII large subunit [Eubacteriales bacterium]
MNAQEKNYISVSELNAAIKTVLLHTMERSILVFGEVSGFKISGGHAYFTLKDKSSQISCVCFSCSRTYIPKDGESVICEGAVDYWEKGGRLSFSVKSIEAVGKGILYLEFERLKAKLLGEGLFDAEKKKPIPAFAKNILVVTSKTGAVIRDIVTTVRRKNPVVNIVVKDVKVQGATAAAEICEALKKVDKLGYDVIIIARGGGSLEDLAPFYDENLVRVIFAMKTPVISAVGHETDFSLCDLVADARAATPTAAAELAAYDYYALINNVSALLNRAQRSAASKFKLAVSRVKLAGGALAARLNAKHAASQNRVRFLAFEASKKLQNTFTDKAHRLEKLNIALDNLSPLKILETGYFKVLNKFGESVSCVKALTVGDKVTAVGGDGRFAATVDEIKMNEENPCISQEV